MNLGIGFPESISKTPRSKKLFAKTKGEESFSPAKRLFHVLLFLLFTILLLQAIKLQLIQGPYYRVLSEQNRIKTKILHAPRGIVYDRNGVPLVLNIPGFREKREHCTSEDSCFRVVSREEVLLRKSKGENLDSLEIDSLREYAKPKVFTHVLGFLSQINKKELEDSVLSAKGYRGGDQIGRGGIEEEYEDFLRGKDGAQLIETDAKGKEIRTLGKTDPIAGKDITLALDSKISEVAFKEMEGKTGAVVVSNPKTGEILSLVSLPSFDANLFTLGDRYQQPETNHEEKEKGEVLYKTVQEVLSDEKYRPLFNRAISGVYPPGSTFKIIVASAALETGAIDEHTTIEDTGVIYAGAFSFSNWYFTLYGKTEGSVDIVRAIKRSNDIFFYKAAEATGLDDLRSKALEFGLSKKLGIDLPNESTGFFPSDSWKRETIGEGWYIGDTYHLGIGQGFLLVTPLQVNAWTNVIANGGTLSKPHVVKNANLAEQVIRTNFLSQKTISLIREGMRQSCDTGGAAWPLFKFKVKSSKLKVDNKNFFPTDEATISGQPNEWIHVPLACKTGTAEFGDPQNRSTHAWLTAYGPLADPQISVTVLVEGGGQGSTVAAPIAKKIFEEWFTR